MSEPNGARETDRPAARHVVVTKSAPAAVGPYSQAVRVGDSVYTAGQIGLDPATGRMVAGGVAAETRQALENLKAILEAAGAALTTVSKTTVYLTNMADFQAVNDVYAGYFEQDPPARSTVAVAALPMHARVEIDALAHVAL